LGICEVFVVFYSKQIEEEEFELIVFKRIYICHKVIVLCER